MIIWQVRVCEAQLLNHSKHFKNSDTNSVRRFNMLRLLFLSLNVAILQGIPIAQVSQVSEGRDRCGYYTNTTIQALSFTTERSFKLDPFECTVPEYFDPLSKCNPHEFSRINTFFSTFYSTSNKEVS